MSKDLGVATRISDRLSEETWQSKNPSVERNALDGVKENSPETVHSENPSNEEKMTTKGSDNPSEPKILGDADSKYSWLVCFAAFFCVFVSIGISNSFGIYQTYYVSNILNNSSASQISWIGSLQTAMMLVASVFSSRIYLSIGLRYTSWMGAVIAFIGLFVSSFVSSLGGLIVTQGLIYGFGIGFVFSVALSTTSQWFEKYRGLALGAVMAGSGLGGLVIARITSAMLNNLGFHWALRISSFFFLAIVVPFTLVFKPRVVSPDLPKLVDFSAFKSPFFICIICMAFMGILGFVAPIFYIPSVVIQLGGTESFAKIQVTIFNCGYLLGGFVVGTLSDLIGPYNAFAICTFFMGLFQLILWVGVKTKPSLSALSFFYGFFAPGFTSQGVSAIAKHFPQKSWAPYIGIMYTVMGCSIIIGNFIISHLLKTTNGELDYDYIARFSSICQVAGSLFAIPGILYLRHIAGDKKTWVN
ncbi:putative transporter MCH4 [Smittium mucronatum]|uniref:Putative transporter MCH4 n=1 Tax=Smittium mucronatum TaxID=133383 RepID=A0A1R0GME5_9FUNG|nr:putative transporter MCH4 [Smittium mucronatum]